MDKSFIASVINCRSFERFNISPNVGDVSKVWILVVFPCNWPMIFCVEIVPEWLGEDSDGPSSLNCKNIARQCKEAAEKISSAVV